MSRPEQRESNMADAKEFQVGRQGIKEARALLCTPQPPPPPRCRPGPPPLCSPCRLDK